MPNTIVPANATTLPVERRFDRSAIMRTAVAYARKLIEREREWYGNRYAAQIRHGGKRPAMKLPSWREAMSYGLKAAWADARTPGPAAEHVAERETVALEILTIQAAERMTRPEQAALVSLRASAANLTPAVAAHVQL